MTSPDCPFCDCETLPREVSAFKGLFNSFSCPTCHTEIKQPLKRKPEVKEPADKSQAQECPDCAFSDLHCFSCDDSICENHIRTFEKYAAFVSPDLGEQLIEGYGNRIYCPLCFQNTFNRFSSTLREAKPEKKPKFFNVPLILFLAIVFLILMMGLRNCEGSKALMDSQHEQTN